MPDRYSRTGAQGREGSSRGRSADPNWGDRSRWDDVPRSSGRNLTGYSAHADARNAQRPSRSGSGGSGGHRPSGGYGARVGGNGPRRTRGSSFDGTLFDDRLKFIFLLFCAVALVIAGRLFWLQVIDAQNIQDSGTSREQTVQVQARRGTIYDRNGTILATTVDCYNVFCHPHVVSSDKVDELARVLAEVCGEDSDSNSSSSDSDEESTSTSSSKSNKTGESGSGSSSSTGTSDDSDDSGSSSTEIEYDEDYFKEKITTDANFVYLYKGIDEEAMQRIKDLGIDGVDFESTTKRVYPCGAVASQIIGVLDSDGNALTGLELQYDSILGGVDGEKTLEYSKEGVPVPGTEKVTTEVVNGQDIVVSIDVDLQEKLEETLELRVEEVQGEGGSAIVMDASTGEIFACSSSPTFDITDLSEVEEGATNLSGISSAYEPGSIMKPVTMLAALEAGTVNIDSTYWCPAALEVGDYTITDSHSRSAEEMDVTTIIAESSNIGISLIARDLGFSNLYDAIIRYGLCDATGVDYPGEASGYIANRDEWTEVQGYNISFGQGLTTSPIEMVRFYAMLANDGVATTPHFLVDVPNEDSARTYETQQITQNTGAIDDLETMMQGAVESDDGTATAAQIDGYRVVGKTGTAEIASESGGYQNGVYNLAFIGYLPDASTNLVCFVGATDVPGERKTVPAFKDIMTFAIDRYNITQD